MCARTRTHTQTLGGLSPWFADSFFSIQIQFNLLQQLDRGFRQPVSKGERGISMCVNWRMRRAGGEGGLTLRRRARRIEDTGGLPFREGQLTLSALAVRR